MMVWLIAMAAQAATATPAPSPIALALGRRVAGSGALATIAPAMLEKDLTELLAEDPKLDPAERAKLVEIGRRRARAEQEKMMDALGAAYARALSIADLQVLVRQLDSPASRYWRAAQPRVMMEAMRVVGGIDYKKETATEFCAATGKLCNR